MTGPDQIEIRRTAGGWEWARRSGASFLPMDFREHRAAAIREATITARILGVKLLIELETM